MDGWRKIKRRKKTTPDLPVAVSDRINRSLIKACWPTIETLQPTIRLIDFIRFPFKQTQSLGKSDRGGTEKIGLDWINKKPIKCALCQYCSQSHDLKLIANLLQSTSVLIINTRTCTRLLMCLITRSRLRHGWPQMKHKKQLLKIIATEDFWSK